MIKPRPECPNAMNGKHKWVKPVGKNAKLIKDGIRVCEYCCHVEALQGDKEVEE